jgi:transposase
VRLAARRSAVQATTDAQRQLHALVIAAPDTLRTRLRGLTTARLVRTYAHRRRAEGKTNREIRRCLVRYVARQFYRLLEANPGLTQHRSV